MKKLLDNQTIFVTRSSEDYPQTAKKIMQRGGDPVCCPMISYCSPANNMAEFDDAIRNINKYNWLFFTSRNGYRFLKQRMSELDLDLSYLRPIHIGVIGKNTAGLVAQDGVHVDFVSNVSDAESFFLAFQTQYKIDGLSYLIPTSQIAQDTLSSLLKKHGGEVNTVIAYTTELANEFTNDVVDMLQQKQPVWVMLTSSSTVHAFMSCLKKIKACHAQIHYASIGPSTSVTLRSYQIEPTVEAIEHHVDGVLQAAADYVNQSN